MLKTLFHLKFLYKFVNVQLWFDYSARSVGLAKTLGTEIHKLKNKMFIIKEMKKGYREVFIWVVMTTEQAIATTFFLFHLSDIGLTAP